jgi:hypothetical protein
MPMFKLYIDGDNLCYRSNRMQDFTFHIPSILIISQCVNTGYIVDGRWISFTLKDAGYVGGYNTTGCPAIADGFNEVMQELSSRLDATLTDLPTPSPKKKILWPTELYGKNLWRSPFSEFLFWLPRRITNRYTNLPPGCDFSTPVRRYLSSLQAK